VDVTFFCLLILDGFIMSSSSNRILERETVVLEAYRGRHIEAERIEFKANYFYSISFVQFPLFFL